MKEEDFSKSTLNTVEQVESLFRTGTKTKDLSDRVPKSEFWSGVGKEIGWL